MFKLKNDFRLWNIELIFQKLPTFTKQTSLNDNSYVLVVKIVQIF